MKTKDNLLLNLLISKINIRYFYVLKSKTFIFTFLIIFSFGMVFIYQEMQKCYIQGNFNFNPIYTPPRILEHETFFVRKISKNFPAIKWNKNQFEISGPSKGNNNFCINVITKFTDKIDEEYKEVLQNLVPTMSQNDLNLFLDVLVDNETRLDQNILNQINSFRSLYMNEQIEILSQNPDKFLIDWAEVKKTNFENVLKQMFIFGIYSLIFSILITTIFDLVTLVRSKNK